MSENIDKCLSAIDRCLGEIDPHADFGVKQEQARENMQECIDNGWMTEFQAQDLYYRWFQQTLSDSS